MSATRYDQLCGRLDTIRGVMAASMRAEFTDWELTVPALTAAMGAMADALGLEPGWDLADLDEALDEVKREAMHRLSSDEWDG